MKALDTSIAVMTKIAEYTNNPKMPMQQITMLLHVMARKEVSMSDLMNLMAVEQSSVSRNAAILGQGQNPREPGYGLVKAYEDPFYRRRKLVSLTPRGEALKAEIDNIPGG